MSKDIEIKENEIESLDSEPEPAKDDDSKHIDSSATGKGSIIDDDASMRDETIANDVHIKDENVANDVQIKDENISNDVQTNDENVSNDVQTNDENIANDVQTENGNSDTDGNSVKDSNVTSGDVISGDVTSGDVASSDLTSGDVASSDLTSGNVISSDVISSDVTSDEVVISDVGRFPRNPRMLAKGFVNLFKRFVGHFEITKVSLIVGIAILVIFAGATLFFRKVFFFETEDNGTLLLTAAFALSIIASLLTIIKVKPLSNKFSHVLSIVLYLLIPVAAMCMAECLNGNFIYNFSPLSFACNYIVYLMLYSLVKLISGSYRVSALVMTPILFVVSLIFSLVLEFRGTPVVPLDIMTITTGLAVASNYVYKVSYTLIIGVILFYIIMVVIAKYIRCSSTRKTRIARRVISLVFLVGILTPFYTTDIAASHGVKPDFWNQTRGYHNSGTILNFFLNTKYLIIEKPDNYDGTDVTALLTDMLESHSDDPGILASSQEIQTKNEEKRLKKEQLEAEKKEAKDEASDTAAANDTDAANGNATATGATTTSGTTTASGATTTSGNATAAGATTTSGTATASGTTTTSGTAAANTDIVDANSLIANGVIANANGAAAGISNSGTVNAENGTVGSTPAVENPNTGTDTELAVRCTSEENQPAQKAKLKDGQVPNIICIMNETYSDLRILGDFSTNIDYMPFTRRLTKNTIKGNLYMPVVGAGTSNSEFEFLTGNSMAFLTAGSNAYELYIKTKLPSLAQTLSLQNYSRTALHVYYGSSWKRNIVYPLLGFERFDSIESFIDNEAIDEYRNGNKDFYEFEAKVNAQYPGENVLLRRFVSDSYDYKLIEQMYEERNADKPFFVFNVTMQNHGSYSSSYLNFNQQVRLTSGEEFYPYTNRYLSLIYESDKALEELIDYFSKKKEPVIICFFGDHQPNIETEFVEELLGSDISDLSVEQQQQRYVTPFIIWANYDIDEAYIDKISANYLSTLLLQVAGLETTKYNDYLSALYSEIPVIDSVGYITADDKYYTYDEDTKYTDTLEAYHKIQYNNLFDSIGRKDELFYLSSDGSEN